MYNYFRSCIYIFLIIEIVMNLPITSDNRVTQFILDLLGRFKMFNSVAGCKVAELVCICVVCIGTKAKKALKFNLKTMVVYPVLAGLTLVGLCFIFHHGTWGMSLFGFPCKPCPVCLLLGGRHNARTPGTRRYCQVLQTTRSARTGLILRMNLFLNSPVRRSIHLIQ